MYRLIIISNLPSLVDTFVIYITFSLESKNQYLSTVKTRVGYCLGMIDKSQRISNSKKNQERK